MKNLFPDAQKKLDETKKLLDNHKKEALARLEEFREQIGQEIDKKLDILYKKKDLTKEVIRRKLELKKFKIGFFRQIFPFNFRYLLSMPFIYGMFLPLLLFDLCIEIYHRICFALYGIPFVKRKDYFLYDRKLLAYLNWFEKLNCYYCSYANGLMAYAREIAARTERFWCPIKHARRLKDPHSQYHLFIDYADGEMYRKKQDKLRCFSKKDGKA